MKYNYRNQKHENSQNKRCLVCCWIGFKTTDTSKERVNKSVPIKKKIMYQP